MWTSGIKTMYTQKKVRFDNFIFFTYYIYILEKVR